MGEIVEDYQGELSAQGRQLGLISLMSHVGPLAPLSRSQYRNLLVTHELYRQRKWMYENRNHHIANRIVSITRPHVRSIDSFYNKAGKVND